MGMEWHCETSGIPFLCIGLHARRLHVPVYERTDTCRHRSILAREMPILLIGDAHRDVFRCSYSRDEPALADLVCACHRYTSLVNMCYR